MFGRDCKDAYSAFSLDIWLQNCGIDQYILQEI